MAPWKIFSCLFRLMILVRKSTSFVNDIGDAEILDIWVLNDKRAELPCEIQVKKSDDSPVLVLWYKNILDKPIYTYDARASSFEYGNRWSNRSLLGERAYFSLYPKPPSLVLDPVAPDDEGYYRCRIDYLNSPTTSHYIRLKVMVLPTKPEIYWNGHKVFDTIGPLIDNSTHTFVCVTRIGRPIPSLVWWIEGSKALSQRESNVYTSEAFFTVPTQSSLNGFNEKLANNYNFDLMYADKGSITQNIDPLNNIPQKYSTKAISSQSKYFSYGSKLKKHRNQNLLKSKKFNRTNNSHKFRNILCEINEQKKWQICKQFKRNKTKHKLLKKQIQSRKRQKRLINNSKTLGPINIISEMKKYTNKNKLENSYETTQIASTESSKSFGDYLTSEVIVQINREKNTKSVSCHAQIYNKGIPVEQPSITVAKLNVTLPPLGIEFEREEKDLFEDSVMKINCLAWGSNPTAILEWWKGGDRISAYKNWVKDDGNISISEMQIGLKSTDHGATITCRAYNHFLNDVMPLVKTMKLNVFYKPKLIVTLKVENHEQDIHASKFIVRRGGPVQFICNVDANPLPKDFQWIKNNEKVTRNDTSSGSASFFINSATEKDSGEYYCISQNLVGFGVSNTFEIHVEHPPKCADGWLELTQGAEIGETRTLLCAVQAVPYNAITFKWYKISSTGNVEIPPKFVQVHGQTSRVVLTANYTNFGTYFCKARNRIGAQVLPCMINFVKASEPDPIYNCSVDAEGQGTISVQCLEGFSGGYKQTFTLEAYQKGKIRANITKMFPQWIVENLSKGKIILKIFASNKKGRSKITTMDLAFTTLPLMADQGLEREETETEVNFDWSLPVLAATLGTAGVIVLTSIFLLCFICFSKGKRHKKTYKNNESEHEILERNMSSTINTYNQNNYEETSLNIRTNQNKKKEKCKSKNSLKTNSTSDTRICDSNNKLKTDNYKKISQLSSANENQENKNKREAAVIETNDGQCVIRYKENSQNENSAENVYGNQNGIKDQRKQTPKSRTFPSFDPNSIRVCLENPRNLKKSRTAYYSYPNCNFKNRSIKTSNSFKLEDSRKQKSCLKYKTSEKISGNNSQLRHSIFEYKTLKRDLTTKSEKNDKKCEILYETFSLITDKCPKNSDNFPIYEDYKISYEQDNSREHFYIDPKTSKPSPAIKL